MSMNQLKQLFCLIYQAFTPELLVGKLSNKKIKLCTSYNIEDCIVARLKAELEYFGKEFASQRHLFDEYEIK